MITAERIQVLRTPVRAQRANGYAKRWVGTVRWELLDRMPGGVEGGGELRVPVAEQKPEAADTVLEFHQQIASPNPRRDGM